MRSSKNRNIFGFRKAIIPDTKALILLASRTESVETAVEARDCWCADVMVSEDVAF